MTSRDEVAVEDAAAWRDHARARRIKNWNTAVDIMAGRSPRPRTAFPILSVKAMRRKIAASSSGVMIVSAHFSTYFLLLDLAPSLDLPFLVLTSDEGVAFWRENRASIPSDVRFVSELKPSDLKLCRQKRCVLFCMADFAASGMANAYVPLLGRLHHLTIAWAQLATKFGFDVYPVVALHSGHHLDVLVDHVPSGDSEPYVLATHVVRRLGDFMSRDPDAWELVGLLTGSHPLPETYSADTARRELLLLAQTDVGIRSALRTALVLEASP